MCVRLFMTTSSLALEFTIFPALSIDDVTGVTGPIGRYGMHKKCFMIKKIGYKGSRPGFVR